MATLAEIEQAILAADAEGNEEELSVLIPEYERLSLQQKDTGQGYVTSALSSVGRGLSTGITGPIGGAGYLLPDALGGQALVDTAAEMEAGIQEALPVNPIYEDTFGMKAFNVLGQAGSMFATGGAGGIAGKALSKGGTQLARQAAVRKSAERAALGSGFLSGSQEGGRAAEQYQMEGINAYLRALGGGATEVLTEKFSPFGMAAETGAARRLLGETLQRGKGAAAKDILSEGVEEMAANTGGNVLNKLFAPAEVETPGIFEGSLEAGALGAVGGTLFAGVNAATGAYRTPADAAREAEFPGTTAPTSDEESERNFAAGGKPIIGADGVVRYAPPERDTTAGVPVVVEGVTIATIPPGSSLSPDDVAAFAAEPDMLKTLARSGQITLPEIVKPVENVDRALTDEMNQNVAAGAANAPATVEELKKAQALYEAQTLARERQAAEETLRQQEAERAAAEEQEAQRLAEEKQTAAREAEERQKRYEAMRAEQSVKLELTPDESGATGAGMKEEIQQTPEKDYATGDPSTPFYFEDDSWKIDKARLPKGSEVIETSDGPAVYSRLPDGSVEAYGVDANGRHVYVGKSNNSFLPSEYANVPLSEVFSALKGSWTYESDRLGDMFPVLDQDTAEKLVRENPPTAEGSAKPAPQPITPTGEPQSVRTTQAEFLQEKGISSEAEITPRRRKALEKEYLEWLDKRGGAHKIVLSVQRGGGVTTVADWKQAYPLLPPDLKMDLLKSVVNNRGRKSAADDIEAVLPLAESLMSDPESREQVFDGNRIFYDISRNRLASDKTRARAQELYDAATVTTPTETPTGEAPTDSLPADQPTSGDVGTGAAVQRDPSKPERLAYLKSKEVNASGGTSLSEAEDAELAGLLGQFPPTPRDPSKPEQMTPGERFNRSPAGVVRPKSLPLGASKKSTRSRLLAQFDRGAAWAAKNDSEKAELSSFQKRNDLFKTRQRNGHFGTDKAAEDYAFWRGAAAFFEAKQANSERRAERSLSGTQKVVQHSDDILIALDSNAPVSAEAVDTYGIKLPEGYVRQGELYVFQPTVTTATETPIDAANVDGGSQSVQTEPAEGSIPAVTEDTVSISDIPSTAEKPLSRGVGGKKSRALPTFTLPPKEPFKPSAERFAQFYVDDGFSEDVALKNGTKLMQAIESGEWTNLLHPDNKKSRAIWETWTRTKLPKGVAATEAAFRTFVAEYRAKTFTTPATELSETDLDAEIMRVAEQAVKPDASEALKRRALELSKELQKRQEQVATSREEKQTSSRRRAIALKALAATGGRGTVGNLTGDSLAQVRANLLSELTGAKVPKAKAGINALMKAFYQEFGIPSDTEAGMRKNLAEAFQRAVSQEAAETPATPRSPAPTPSTAETSSQQFTSDTIEDALTSAEKSEAATELGHSSWGKEALEDFKARLADWLVTGKTVSKKLAAIFKRLVNSAKALAVAGLSAISVNTGDARVTAESGNVPVQPVAFRAVLNDMPAPKFRFPAGLPQSRPLPQAQQRGVLLPRPRTPRVADFGNVRAPAEVVNTANWVVDNDDTQGRPFVIADKKRGWVYVFNADGSLEGRNPAIFGKDTGDTRKKGTRVTPSGRFEATVDPDAGPLYGTTVDFMETEESVLAIHRVYLPEAKERRRALESKGGADNRMSHGCINVEDTFYDDTLQPLFNESGGVVYILPETKSGAKPSTPRSPAENLVSFTAANGQKLVGEVQSVTGNKATVAYQWNGKTKTQVVPVSQLGSPVASVATPPKYQYNQEQNTRKLGKHFPTALGVHANHDFRKSFASMAKDTSLGQSYQMIARMLSKMPEFKGMDLHLVADENIKYAGEYSWNNGKPSIAINLRLIARGQVDALGSVLHEALHHATLAKVRNPQGAFENEVVSKLDLIRESVREYAESRGFAEALEYELGSTEEFITALFTRPDFQALIASIPDSAAPGVAVGKFRSILSEIFRLIAELVHGKPVLRGSALEQAMTTSLALFNTPFRAIETGGLEALNAARSPGKGVKALFPQTGDKAAKPAETKTIGGLKKRMVELEERFLKIAEEKGGASEEASDAFTQYSDARIALKNAEVQERHPGTTRMTLDMRDKELASLQDMAGGRDASGYAVGRKNWKRGKKERSDPDLGDVFKAEGSGALFRSVSLGDYQRILKTGVIDTDFRGAISDKEGINLTPDTATATNYIPSGGTGVVIAINTDGLDLHMISADDYIRSMSPIPASRIVGVSKPITVDKESGAYMLHDKAAKPINLSAAYQKAAVGKSSQWVPIKEVYEQAKADNPSLTPEAFMAQIEQQNEAGGVMISPVENVSTVEAARPFVVGNAGVEMLVPSGTAASRIDEETDAEYLAAVEAGDVEKAQAMVDAAAKAAGYNVGPVYHHGGFDIRENAVPDTSRGFHMGTRQAAEERAFGKPVDDFIAEAEVTYDEDLGAWFWSSQGTDSYDVIDEEGFSSEEKARRSLEEFASQEDFSDSDIEDLGNLTAAYVRVSNPLVVADQKADWGGTIERAVSGGHDAVQYRNDFEDKGSTSYIPLQEGQIKSADPVTYDSSGAPIPLSQRFNPESPSILYAAPIDISTLPTREPASGENVPDREAGSRKNAETVSQRLESRREEAISAAVAENDWGNYTREQKVAAAESFLAKWVVSFSAMEFPADVRFSVEAGDGSGAHVSVHEVPSRPLGIRVSVGQNRGFDKYANLSPTEVFAHLYDTAQEESIHVAQYLGMHRDWLAAREQGFKGTFLSYLGQKLKATFAQVNKARIDLQQTDPAAAEKIRDAMLASWNIYHFNDRVEGIAGLWSRLEGDPSRQGDFIMEMVRQLTQLKRQDFTTETGWQKFTRVLKQWLTDAINALRGVQDVFRSGMAGDLIQRQLADLEAALDGKPLPPVSRPAASRADDGEGVIDIGGEAEPADGGGTQLFQKRKTAIGSTFITAADTTLQERRSQEETLAKARKIIAEEVQKDEKGGRAVALQRFKSDMSIPPEVRTAGSGLIAQQADLLANLERDAIKQEGLDALADEAGKVSGIIGSDLEYWRNLQLAANLDIDKMAEEAGRTLNIFNVFRRLTPEGFLRRMKRQYNATVQESMAQNFDIPPGEVEAEIMRLWRMMREAGATARGEAIAAALKAFMPRRVNARKIIESLFPQAGTRQRMSKGGEALVRNFFQMMAGPRDQKGPLAEFDESIQNALSGMLRKVMEAKGLVAKNQSNQATDIDKLVRSVSADELRFDKIAAADEAMQQELDAIEDPERRATLRQAWEEATAKMYTNIASDATVRRAINAELKGMSVDWRKMFDSNQKPDAIKAKVVDAVMAKIERLLTDAADPTVRQNLNMLRDEVVAAFDFIAANKRTEWLAYREGIEARRRVAEHRAAFMEALRNQGVAEDALLRISQKLLAGPLPQKPDQNPVSALVGEHMKEEVPNFVDKLVALDVDRATAEQLDTAAKALRADIAEVERLKAAERAVKKLMDSLKPKPRAPREKIEKALKALFTAAETGALDSQEFFDALGEALGHPPLTPAQQEKIKKLTREINALPKGAARVDKQQELDEELALWKGIAARDVLLSAWYANILSGISTQGIGLFGNLVNFIPRSLFLAATNPRSAKAYFQGAFGEGLKTGLREAAAAMKGRGLYKVSKYGDKNMVSALELLRKKGPATLPEWVAYIASAGTNLRYVFRVMQAIDALAWNTAREGQAYLAAHRALLDQQRADGVKRTPEEFYRALIDNLGGDAKRIEEDMRAAREDLITRGQTPDLLTVDRMAREARNARRLSTATKLSNRFADRSVMQQDPEGIGDVISSIITVIQKKGNFMGVPFGQLLIPFNKIVANLFEQSLDYTPVGALRSYFGGHLTDIQSINWSGKAQFKDKAVQFDAVERAERMAASVTGTLAASVMFALASLFKDEPDEDVPFMLYGFGPESKSKRDQMPKGWTPYSAKIGDTYIKFSEMPFGVMFAAAGNALDAMRYKNMDKKSSAERLAYVLKTSAKGFTEQGVLSSFDTALEVLTFQASDKKFTDVPVNVAKGMVPAQGMLRDLSVLFDPVKIKDDTISAALLRDFPVVRRIGTRPALNVFGEPMTFDGRIPFVRRIATVREKHPVADYLGRNGLSIPGMAQTIVVGQYLPKDMKDRIQRRALQTSAMENGVFTVEQDYNFRKRAGELTKAAVEGLLTQVPTITSDKQRENVQNLINRKVEIARRRAMLEAVPAQ